MTQRLRKRSILLTGTIAVALMGTSAARGADPSTDAAADEIKALKTRLEQLEKQQTDISRRVDKETVDRTMDQVVEDAARRSKLMNMGGMSATYEHGKFVIKSDDGSFSWHPWLHLQVRGVANYREEFKNGGSDTQTGLELRRARFGFDGNVMSPDITYAFDWATYRGSGNTNAVDATGTKLGTVNNSLGGLPVLEEAWVKYHIPDTDFSIRAGQMHDPLSHEAIVGSKYDMTAERSLQNDIFANTDTFTQAVTLVWDPKSNIRFEGGVTDGIRAANTNFQDFPNNGIQYNYGLAGRVEYKVMGDWGDYNQFTSLNNKKDLLVFGAGADYSESGHSSTLTHAVDAQYASTGGLFLYGSYIGRYTSHTRGIPLGAPVSSSFGTPANPDADTYEPSVLAQASYLIDNKWEPFLRYEYMQLAGTPAGSKNQVHEITVGLTRWLYGHNAKFTAQLMYLPNGIPVSDDSSDVLISNNKNELILTTQFQLLL